MGLENARASTALDQQYVIGIALVPHLHTGRPDRHSGYGEADGVRLFREQSLDVRGWDMAFQRVSAHLGGVAGTKLRRHTKTRTRGAMLRVVLPVKGLPPSEARNASGDPPRGELTAARSA